VTQVVVEAAAAGVRQADDLLPAVHADARRHPRHPADLDTGGHAALPGAAGDGAKWGSTSRTRCSRRPTVSRRRSSSAARFVGSDAVALVLGDNIFYGHDLVAAAAARERAHAARRCSRIRSPIPSATASPSSMRRPVSASRRSRRSRSRVTR
jgi:hypothetical protein